MASPYPNIGSLNQPIVIEKNTPVKSPQSGQYVDNWTIFKTAFANINFNSGTEKEQDNAIISTQMIIFTTRYFQGVDVKMRILYENEYYNIRQITKIGRNRYMKLKGERIQ